MFRTIGLVLGTGVYMLGTGVDFALNTVAETVADGTIKVANYIKEQKTKRNENNMVNTQLQDC